MQPNKRIFNNAKISDHFAIIPTAAGAQAPERSRAEALRHGRPSASSRCSIPAAEYLVTTRITRVEGEPFKTEGKVLVNAGWLAVYGKRSAGRRRRRRLAPVQPKREGRDRATSSVEANQTKPPPRFTEATLLSRHGRRGQAGRGRGTARSDARQGTRHAGHARPDHRGPDRARHYLHREGRELIPTAKAFSLLTAAARVCGIEELTSPELTGEWEYKLAADGARADCHARRLHARDRRDDAPYRAIRPRPTRATPCPAISATLNTPCPKCGGVDQGELQEVPVPELRLRPVEDRRRPPVRDRGNRDAARRARRSGRCRASAARWAGRSPPIIRLNDAARAGIRFRPGPRMKAASAEPVDFAEQEAAGQLSEVRRRRVRARHGLRLRKIGRRRSRRCDFRSGKIILQQADRARADAEAAGRQARPICSRASFRRARSANSRPISCVGPTERWASNSKRARQGGEGRDG
ncbi:MAG: DNA topoisomerase [Comamonadaceae bacterium]|nr:DNA topoisomerase [Comamonadaceae bacterium]